ncbi:MAG: hypothetical protein M1832_003022 [Thelocarpon impressellum]|nr:MAG: hypothetical protein M1832_003022 [Thelocarpon impressellum]
MAYEGHRSPQAEPQPAPGINAFDPSRSQLPAGARPPYPDARDARPRPGGPVVPLDGLAPNGSRHPSISPLNGAGHPASPGGPRSWGSPAARTGYAASGPVYFPPPPQQPAPKVAPSRAPSQPETTPYPTQFIPTPSSPSARRSDTFSYPPPPSQARPAPNRPDTSAYPPELVAQITEQITEDVIRRLKLANLDASATAPPLTRSRSQSQAHARTNSQAMSDYPTAARPDTHTPSSPRTRQDSAPYEPAPRQHSIPSASAAPGGVTQSSLPRDAPPVRQGERGPPSPENQASSRPPPDRKPTDKDETPLDRTWGQLFDETGKSTARLGQFLRGLANHIIEDFEPKESIVVTPTKMEMYYELCRLDTEMWQWRVVFRELSCPRLSRLYQELECQHHLVQDGHGNTPTIPGLTAVGFARWMTLLLLARPDDEVARLQKAVLEMPISNADDQKERFPKDISRRLFPKVECRRTREKLERLLPPAEARAAKPELARPDQTANVTTSQPIERERQPYSNVSTDSVDSLPQSPRSRIERERAPYSGTPSDTTSEGPSLPPGGIERERMPYTAQPGGGKAYEPEPKPDTGRASSANRDRRPSMTARPWDIPHPEMSHHNRTSSNANPPPRERRRSPSTSQSLGGSRRSDPDIVGFPDGGSADSGTESRRWGREPNLNRADRARRETSPARFDRDRYVPDSATPPRRGFEEDYYRQGGRGVGGNGYDYNQPYPPTYR